MCVLPQGTMGGEHKQAGNRTQQQRLPAIFWPAFLYAARVSLNKATGRSGLGPGSWGGGGESVFGGLSPPL